MKTPTSTTNPKPTARGFTLIELLVVLAIVGLLVSLTPVAYTKLRDSAQYSATLRSVVGALRNARQQAITQGEASTFVIDLKQRKFGLSDAMNYTLPDALQIRATIGSEQLSPGGVASIEFLPDGGATGGSVELIRPSGEGARIRVDWLSGQVTQERLLK